MDSNDTHTHMHKRPRHTQIHTLCMQTHYTYRQTHYTYRQTHYTYRQTHYTYRQTHTIHANTHYTHTTHTPYTHTQTRYTHRHTTLTGRHIPCTQTDTHNSARNRNSEMWYPNAGNHGQTSTLCKVAQYPFRGICLAMRIAQNAFKLKVVNIEFDSL